MWGHVRGTSVVYREGTPLRWSLFLRPLFILFPSLYKCMNGGGDETIELASRRKKQHIASAVEFYGTLLCSRVVLRICDDVRRAGSPEVGVIDGEEVCLFHGGLFGFLTVLVDPLARGLHAREGNQNPRHGVTVG